MRKLFIAICVCFLSGCGLDLFLPDTNEKSTKYGRADISGTAQQGFALQARGLSVYADCDYGDGSLDSATGEFFLEKVILEDSIVEVGARAQDYVEGNRVKNNMDLSAVINAKRTRKTNLNYLTTLASELILHYYMQGNSFAEAREKANKVVLKNLRLPQDLSDFENYSVYGGGNGDAMLAAVSIVIEKYYMEHSMSTSWITLKIDTASGEFVDSLVFKRLSQYAANLLEYDGADSVRKAIAAKSPTGKVANFEKYLSILYAETKDGKACDAENRGEILGFGDAFHYNRLVCSDSVWRNATLDDFDINDKFNPNVDYGTLVDARDGHTYKTLQLGSRVWMAENLNYADSSVSPNLKGQSWCYDNDEKMCGIFGRLYSWTAAMDIPKVYLDSIYMEIAYPYNRGICPEGWHVPNSDDIFAFPSGYGDLLSSYMDESLNESGFSVLLGGGSYIDYKYDEMGDRIYGEDVLFEKLAEMAYMWTDGMESYGSARKEYFVASRENGVYGYMFNEQASRRDGAYVRCVQDME